MPQKTKEKIINILELLKWGKMPLEGEGRIATTCSNAFEGINPCCAGCPPCNCHRELEEFADQILELVEAEKQKWAEEDKFLNRGFCKCQKRKKYEERIVTFLNDQWLCQKCAEKRIKKESKRSGGDK